MGNNVLKSLYIHRAFSVLLSECRKLKHPMMTYGTVPWVIVGCFYYMCEAMSHAQTKHKTTDGSFLTIGWLMLRMHTANAVSSSDEVTR